MISDVFYTSVSTASFGVHLARYLLLEPTREERRAEERARASVAE